VPNNRIGVAGNTIVPALIALEQLGYSVVTRNSSDGKVVIATRGEEEYSAEDPVAVLGLIKLIELRTWQWGASDSEVEKTMLKYHLGN
jgi:hypothetical protein